MALALADVSIKTKIAVVIGLLIIALVINVGFGNYKMTLISQEVASIAEEDIPLTRVVTEITINQLEQAISFERMLRFGSEIQNDNNYRTHFKQAIDNFDKYSKLINQELDLGNKIALRGKQLARNDRDYQEFNHVEKLLIKIKGEHKEYEKHVYSAYKLIEQGQIQQALNLAEEIEKEEKQINHELETVLIELGKFTEAAALQAEHDQQSAIQWMTIIAITSLLITLPLAYIVISGILQGLRKAVFLADHVASGDLTHNIESSRKDEIGQLLQSLNNMQNSLRDIVMHMGNSASQLAAASEELSVVTQDTNQALLQQTSEIQLVATAMNEMTATVQEVANNATNTSTSSNNATQDSASGSNMVQDTINSIKSLANDVEQAAGVIHNLEKDSENIGSVLDEIKGIAEQTNLLALNAAIEAARAGEQGRGFAVVADEVRTLASRTQQSTTEIEEMIDTLQKGTHSAVEVMQAGQSLANDCVQKATNAGTALQKITHSVSEISDMNVQIATAAEEQTSVAEEINRNISNIHEATERTTIGSKETSTASEELARMATKLQDLVCHFKVQAS